MTETITLDTRKCESTVGNARIAPLRRGERGNVPLVVFVRRNCRPYDLTGMTAHLVWKAADGKLVGPVPMEVTDPATGTVRCTLPDACYSTVGTARAYVELRMGAELVDTTDELSVKVLDCIDADAEQAEEYKPLIAEVREATDAAIKAAASAESGEEGRVKAETSRASAETAREQAETERTNGWANLKADAQTAIAEVKATEAKLYPAAENVLVGSETGTFIHVDDAFSGAALREITVEGACKQDGTPSPDNPVPIQVVENPIFTDAGKNLLSPSKMAKTWVNYVDADGELQVKYGDGRAWFAIPEYGVLPAGTYYVCGDNIEIRRVSDNTSIVYNNGNVAMFKLDTATSISIKVGFGHPDSQYPYVSHAMLLASSRKDVSYEPYTSASLTFTLPAEHPYLAKLPDGTADEIVVDRNGNVILIARVAKAKVPDKTTWTIQENRLYSLGYSGIALKENGVKKNVYDAIICEKYQASQTFKNEPCIGITDVLWIVPRTNSGDITAEECAKAANGMTFYAPLAEEVRYQLGRIEMPKAQDSIVNAWTDAEVTPNTAIEYVRDVNIVVANIEKAIAAERVLNS